MTSPLTERDYETLRELDAANRSHAKLGFRKGWARQMDCGGYNGSHHSYTLTKLTLRGLVEVMMPSTKHPGRSRYSGGKHYRITKSGIAAIYLTKKKTK